MINTFQSYITIKYDHAKHLLHKCTLADLWFIRFYVLTANLTMEAVCPSDTLVTSCKTTWHHIREDQRQ
jgi:hypothetical protein